MMYGHYLQRKGQHMAKFCVTPAILRRDHAVFYSQLSERWEALEKKRQGASIETAVEKKRQKALLSDGYSEDWSVNTDDVRSAAAVSVSSSSVLSLGKVGLPAGGLGGFAYKPPQEKQRLRQECQKFWDKAFIMCGIPWTIADNPYFREALEQTRAIPDFKINCAKTT